MEKIMKKVTQITTSSFKISLLALLFFVTAAPTAIEYGLVPNTKEPRQTNRSVSDTILEGKGEVTGLRGDHPGNRLIQRQGSRNSSDKTRKTNSVTAAPFVPGGAVLGIEKDDDRIKSNGHQTTHTNEAN